MVSLNWFNKYTKNINVFLLCIQQNQILDLLIFVNGFLVGSLHSIYFYKYNLYKGNKKNYLKVKIWKNTVLVPDFVEDWHFDLAIVLIN